MFIFANELTEWIYEYKRCNVFLYSKCPFYLSVNINQLCKQSERKHKNSLLLKLWGIENKVALFISAFLDGAISAEIEAI